MRPIFKTLCVSRQHTGIDVLEYLIKVETDFGTFMVHAGRKKPFAEKMFETFTLRDLKNKEIPHTKQFVEMHTEDKDAGFDGPVEIPTPNMGFDEFVEKDRKEYRQRELDAAEARISAAIREMEKRR